jgi:hypothetical protein
MAVDIRVTNASIGIEGDDAQFVRVDNASIGIEETDTQFLILNNAAIMVEYNLEVNPYDTYHTLYSHEVRLVDPAVHFGDAGLATYGDFVAAEEAYFTRADEAGTSITDAITLGCWCWFDAESTGAATGLISKWLEAGNLRSYVLYKNAANSFVFSISSNGTAVTTITDSVANYGAGEWFFVAGKLTQGDKLSLFVNGTWYTNVTTIPMGIYDSTEALDFGRYNHSNYLDGRMCHAFLCGYAVPDWFIEALYAHTKSMFISR